MDDFRDLDPLCLELGYDLIPLVARDEVLGDRIRQLRQRIEHELGLVIPPIRIIDNILLEPSQYCFKINGVEAGQGTIKMDSYLAINPGVEVEVAGEETIDPVSGLPARWVSEDNRKKAELAGYTVLGPNTIIFTHLCAIIKLEKYSKSTDKDENCSMDYPLPSKSENFFKRKFDNFFKNPNNLFMALLVLLVVLMLIIPLPTMLLDILMVMNLVITLLIFLTVLCTKKVTGFSILPTILLVVTIFGFSLNVTSTLLILTMGANFDGRIIRAFSTLIISQGGIAELVVGFVFIIIAVLVLVITKGAIRIAEVAARFALDSLPGRQMAIEATYNSGTITEEEAIAQKNELKEEVDFYGALDGSGHFISGNVKMGILITAVTILGGIIIGTTIYGESMFNAVETYISFAIVAGILISMFPTTLMVVAIGIIVTRSDSNDALQEDGSR